MAISSFQTLLSLDEWGKIFGIAPEYLNGFQRTGRMLDDQCNSVWFQNPWASNGDRLSIEELAEAIHEAEQMLMRELGYAPAPYWTLNEWQPYPRPHVKPLYGLDMRDTYNQMRALKLTLGHVIAGGVRATTLVSAGAAIAYSVSPQSGSTYQDLATIAVATSVTNPCELQVFFTTGQGAPSAAHVRYQVRPLKVSISGGIATITGDRALFVLPQFHEQQTDVFTAADVGAGDTHFAQTIDVYRVYNDTNGDAQQQGVLVWENEPQDCPDPPCAVTTQTLCLGLRDRDLGIVNPYAATWDATTLAYTATCLTEGRDPDRVRVNYYSGVPRQAGADGCVMDWRYARMVARLAMAMLPKTKCGCEQSERQMAYWFEPPTYRVEFGKPEIPSSQVSDNPFGQGRGAIYAWREVVRERLGAGILVA